MTISGPEDRFKELGMEVPDLSFLEVEEDPARRWGRENPYSTRTLEGNWFEERRAYKLHCGRCTGHSITRTDYLAPCAEDYNKEAFVLARQAAATGLGGSGPNFLYNTEDYCDYLSNYTTTYDLVHNWEIRRAGVKPKGPRRWKLIMNAIWTPENDNAVSFGNLTQLGYRKAPQLPLLPADWDVYANNPTTYEESFREPRYPSAYVHCRKSAPKAIRKENEDMSLVPRTDTVCSKCKEDHDTVYKHCDPKDKSCPCVCHAVEAKLKHPNVATPRSHYPYNSPRFPRLVPASTLREHPGMQNLHSTDAIFPYRALKHPPHPTSLSCDPHPCPEKAQLPHWKPKDTSPFKAYKDICTDYAGDIKQE